MPLERPLRRRAPTPHCGVNSTCVLGFVPNVQNGCTQRAQYDKQQLGQLLYDGVEQMVDLETMVLGRWLADPVEARTRQGMINPILN